MKVVFLDIDGVLFLNKNKTYEGWGSGSIFSADCCKRLKEILDETNCKLVLTSSLRLHEEGRAEVLRNLAPYSITKDDFIGVTPDICSSDRSLEIISFLRKNPSIANFIVIDDNDIGYRIPNRRIIKTDSNQGITEDIVKKAISLLGKKQMSGFN